MKRSIDSLEPSPGGYIYITFMLSMPQETSGKKGQKNIVIARIPRRLERNPNFLNRWYFSPHIFPPCIIKHLVLNTFGLNCNIVSHSSLQAGRRLFIPIFASSFKVLWSDGKACHQLYNLLAADVYFLPLLRLELGGQCASTVMFLWELLLSGRVENYLQYSRRSKLEKGNYQGFCEDGNHV